MDPLTFSIIYKKNLANPLRNASTTAYCTRDPWCTRDQSNTVVEILMLGTITNIRDVVYNTNCFGWGSFDDLGVLRRHATYWDQCWPSQSHSYADQLLHLPWVLYIGQRRNRMQPQCRQYSSEQESSASRCSHSRGPYVPLCLGEWSYGRQRIRAGHCFRLGQSIPMSRSCAPQWTSMWRREGRHLGRPRRSATPTRCHCWAWGTVARRHCSCTSPLAPSTLCGSHWTSPQQGIRSFSQQAWWLSGWLT